MEVFSQRFDLMTLEIFSNINGYMFLFYKLQFDLHALLSHKMVIYIKLFSVKEKKTPLGNMTGGTPNPTHYINTK